MSRRDLCVWRSIDFATPAMVVVLVLLCFVLGGCATLQQPKPIGEPSPLACYGAKRTHDAWKELIEKYINDMMAAQVAYSCSPAQAPIPPPTLKAP